MKAMAERARVIREWQVLPRAACRWCWRRCARSRSTSATSTCRTWSAPARVWRECATLTAIPLLGLPGLAVPTGVVDGLPTGVTLLAARFREDLCLAAGEAIEARAGMAAQLPAEIAW